jgi:hypothetical protein
MTPGEWSGEWRRLADQAPSFDHIIHPRSPRHLAESPTKETAMKTEPALIVGTVQALLVLLVAFGLPISDDQVTAVLAAAGAILALVGAVVVRGRVTPTSE